MDLRGKYQLFRMFLNIICIQIYYNKSLECTIDSSISPNVVFGKIKSITYTVNFSVKQRGSNNLTELIQRTYSKTV